MDLNDFSSRAASAFLDYAALYDRAMAPREGLDKDRLLVEALRALERSLEELREADETILRGSVEASRQEVRSSAGTVSGDRLA